MTVPDRDAMYFGPSLPSRPRDSASLSEYNEKGPCNNVLTSSHTIAWHPGALYHPCHIRPYSGCNANADTAALPPKKMDTPDALSRLKCDHDNREESEALMKKLRGDSRGMIFL